MHGLIFDGKSSGRPVVTAPVFWVDGGNGYAVCLGGMNELISIEIDAYVTRVRGGTKKDKITWLEFLPRHRPSHADLIRCRTGQIDIKKFPVDRLDKTGAIHTLEIRPAHGMLSAFPSMIFRPQARLDRVRPGIFPGFPRDLPRRLCRAVAGCARRNR